MGAGRRTGKVKERSKFDLGKEGEWNCTYRPETLELAYAVRAGRKAASDVTLGWVAHANRLCEIADTKKTKICLAAIFAAPATACYNSFLEEKTSGR